MFGRVEKQAARIIASRDAYERTHGVRLPLPGADPRHPVRGRRQRKVATEIRRQLALRELHEVQPTGTDSSPRRGRALAKAAELSRDQKARKIALEAATVLLTPGGKAKLVAGAYFLVRRGADKFAPLILDIARTAAQREGVTEIPPVSGPERRLARAVAAVIPAVNAGHLEALSQAARWQASALKERKRRTRGN
ncbi:MAG TPA: hypothetical protein VLF20_05785 [Patescibacteria group bacterium]|nr:hypothetical protein [Patescibacteria group bacterium]